MTSDGGTARVFLEKRNDQVVLLRSRSRSVSWTLVLHPSLSHVPSRPVTTGQSVKRGKRRGCKQRYIGKWTSCFSTRCKVKPNRPPECSTRVSQITEINMPRHAEIRSFNAGLVRDRHNVVRLACPRDQVSLTESKFEWSTRRRSPPPRSRCSYV